MNIKHHLIVRFAAVAFGYVALDLARQAGFPMARTHGFITFTVYLLGGKLLMSALDIQQEPRRIRELLEKNQISN